MVKQLVGIHPGETAWIVGKGPSLVYLRAEHFGPGPVITINQAILVVQDLGLSNQLYSMQKDGCSDRSTCPVCPKERASMVYPHQDVTVILQSHCDGMPYSEYCLPDHPRRILIEPTKELGFDRADVMSIRMCAAIARIMGCASIVFVCCDSLANGDTRRLDVLTGEIVQDEGTIHYVHNNPRLLEDIGSFPYSTLTP